MKVDFKDRIDKAVEYLDKRRPGWAHEVDLDILAMKSCSKCVLGQLKMKMGIVPDDVFAGFCLGYGDGWDAFFYGNHEAFTEAWRERIRQERAA